MNVQNDRYMDVNDIYMTDSENIKMITHACTQGQPQK